MCGIAAIYSSRPLDDIETRLSSAIDTLEHRGPDDEGMWWSPKKTMGLAHTRLSIIDPVGGHQPLHADPHHVVVNGEIYNYQGLRDRYSAMGTVFDSRSDSEVLLPLYAEHGASAASHLRGEYAFILADERQNCLWAARDRFGSKPLYYYVSSDGTVYLASEIRALLAMGVPRYWNVSAYLHRRHYFGHETLVKGVFAVPPGHDVRIDVAGLRCQRYWALTYPDRGDECDVSDHTQCVSDVRAHLLEAVRVRLHADVPVGVYLSGGLDSSAILGMASSILPRPIDTFSIAFDHPDYSEEAIARDSATYFGANPHILTVTQDDLADALTPAIVQAESVCMNSHVAAKYLLSHYVSAQGVKVVLTGEGADELFAGYPAFRQDLHRLAADDIGAERVLADNKLLAGVNVAKTIDAFPHLEKHWGLTPSWVSPQMRIAEVLAGLLDPTMHWSSERCLEDLCQTQDLMNLRARDPVHNAMLAFTLTFLPNYFLSTLGDRMEMAHSIEGRQPFLDHVLAEYVAQLPVSVKIQNGIEKAILREAVRPYVTEQVYRRQKHPFAAPPAVIDPASRLYALVRESLSSCKLSISRF